MANTLGIYNPIFYAQEALLQLEESLGMASRVYRRLDTTPSQKGSVVSVRRPSSFTAASMPVSASDLDTGTVSVTLDQWKGVTFQLTDLELTYTREQIISDHIRPAAVAVAKLIDASLCGLWNRCPWKVAGASTAVVTEITSCWQRLFDNKVPQGPDWHLMLDGERTADFLALAAFSQWQGAGAAGVATQQTASLGRKFDFEIFSNQQVGTTGTGVAITSITQLQLNAAAAKGATTVVIKDSDGVLAGSVIIGDVILIAGSTQQYVITAGATAGSNIITVLIYPALVIAYSEDDNVTLTQTVAAKKQNLAFHKNFAALAMAPLSDLGNNRGAEISVISDPITNLSLRSRIWYDGTNARLNIGIDALWGFVTLDPNMAVRYES